MIRTTVRFLFAALGLCAAIQAEARWNEAPPGPAQLSLSQEGVQQWADAYFGKALESHEFSGLAVVVVQGGEVLLSKSYGYSDYERRIRIDMGQTVFSIASITKLFTAMAIARLVQDGRIASLDDPANKYLKRFQLPQPAGKQIRIWDLLTHRAGFEDTLWRALTDRDDNVVPVPGAAFDALMPQLVLEPGTRSSYSNFGFGVLGAIVEDVTGNTFEQFESEHFFAPLGMSSTLIGLRPLPRTPQIAVPYIFYPDGSGETTGVGVAGRAWLAPAGLIMSTPVDMTRFMLAQLDAGRGDSARVLSPESFQLMQETHSRNHPAVSGFGMAFFTSRMFDDGERMIWHSGGGIGQQTMLALWPESNAGILVLALTGAPQPSFEEQLRTPLGHTRLTPNPAFHLNGAIRPELVARDFYYNFAGEHAASVPPLVAKISQPLDPFEGVYWRNRRTHSRAYLFHEFFMGGAFEVRKLSDTELQIRGKGPYVQIEQGVFRRQGDASPWDTYAFNFDVKGRVVDVTTYISSDIYSKAQGMEQPLFFAKLLLILLPASLLGIPAAFLKANRRGEHAAKWLPVVSTALVLGIPAALLLGYPADRNFVTAVMYGEETRLVVATILAHLAVLVALAMTWLAAEAWRCHYWGLSRGALCRRVYLTALALISLAFVPEFAFLNLLGNHLPG